MRAPTARGLRIGLLTTAVAVTVGLVAAVVAPHDSSQLYRNVVSVVTNSLVIGYVAGVFGPVFDRLNDDVARLEPLLPAGAGETVLMALDPHGSRALWVAALLGFGYGFLPNLDLLGRVIEGRAEAMPYVWVLLLVPALWAVVFPALWRLYRVSRVVYRLGREQIRIDLDELRPLDVFAEVGVRHLLIIAIGLAFVPIQAILLGGLDWKDFVPAVVVTLPLAVLALLAPVLGVHRAMTIAKRAELDRLAGLLKQTDRASDRYLLLALRRAQVDALSEWPFTLGSAARIAVYVIIPPCAWIAAALVENWVSSALS